MNTQNEGINWALTLQVKWRPENYSAPVLTIKSIFPSANLFLFKWPKYTALLFCFYIINLELWQGSMPLILWGRGLRENSAGFLHSLTTEPMQTQKHQIFQTKFGEARGEFLLLLLLLSYWGKKKCRPSRKASYFSGRNLKSKFKPCYLLS